MREIKIFENEEFGNIRTMVNEEGTILFSGLDVARALGYLDPKKAVKQHCKKDGGVIYPLIDNLGREQKSWFITEGNVYRLIVKSKLPAAERFEKWVFEEVLPTIRQTGGYITPQKLEDIFTNPDNLSVFLNQMLVINEENKRLRTDIESIKPKVRYFDKMVSSNLLVNLRTTAKELNIGQKYFIDILIKKKYLYRDSRNVLQPYMKYVKKGLFEIKEYYRNGYKGTYPYLTTKGRKFFLEMIEEMKRENTEFDESQLSILSDQLATE